jgi:hypothetical protein
MDNGSFESFRKDVDFMWRRATSSWAALMLTSGTLDREALAMVTLQMYHYVKHTLAVCEYALASLPPGTEHDDFRALLSELAEGEAGHDRLALRDLDRLGYDAGACAETLPLPTTLNLHGANRLAIDTYGPYYLLGETYATETTGAQISAAIFDAYAGDPTTARGAEFYRVHGEADVQHAARAEACLRRCLPAHRRVITLGCLTAWRNLMGLGMEIQHYKLYPEPFQLVPRR